MVPAPMLSVCWRGLRSRGCSELSSTSVHLLSSASASFATPGVLSAGAVQHVGRPSWQLPDLPGSSVYAVVRAQRVRARDVRNIEPPPACATIRVALTLFVDAPKE